MNALTRPASRDFLKAIRAAGWRTINVLNAATRESVFWFFNDTSGTREIVSSVVSDDLHRCLAEPVHHRQEDPFLLEAFGIDHVHSRIVEFAKRSVQVVGD